MGTRTEGHTCSVDSVDFENIFRKFNKKLFEPMNYLLSSVS